MIDYIVSPLAPKEFPTLPPIAGVKIAAFEAGIRYKNRDDVLLVVMDSATQVAGVFTRSLTASAPVLACRQALLGGSARVLVVNAGNSNAFTGKSGVASVARVQDAACQMFGCALNDFFMASTGVIGEKLPDHKITSALPAMAERLSDLRWEDAARTIMTTDTYPKMATRHCTIGDASITINGIAKGSGMIAPDMATLLSFVFTDAVLPATVLQSLLDEMVQTSFNAITVDGDTSTSDTLLLFATNKAKHAPIMDAQSEMLDDFKQALSSLFHELAMLVVKDGEGAERLITIRVSGAQSASAARAIGMSIGNSPLVKTAIAAGDANWGRIVAAVGKAGEKADRDKLSIHIGGVSVAKDGEADPSYKESAITDHMQGRDIHIMVDVGVGSGSFTVYSCDLTHRYIDINGSYRS